MTRKLLFLALMSSFLLSAEENITETYGRKTLLGVWAGNHRAVLPKISSSEVPKLDGRIEDAEWRKGVQYAGFLRNGKGLLPNQRGFVSVMTDGKYLYLAIKTTAPNNDPGGGLATRATTRDGSVYADDSVELMFHPVDSEPDTAYHLIINNNGAVFDRKLTRSTNHFDMNWNISDIKIGTRAESGWWDLEVRIPLAEIGKPKQQIRFNVARNWNGIGATALMATGNHLDSSKMIALYWYDKAPTFRVEELGAPEDGEWNVRIRSENPTGETYAVGAMLRHYTYPVVNGKVQTQMTVDTSKICEIPPGGSADLNLKLNVGDNISRWLTVTLFHPKTKEVLFSRLLTAQKEIFAGNHPVTGSFELNQVGNGLVWYYPSYQKAAVRVNLKNHVRAREILADFGGQKIALKREQNYFRGLVPVPSVPGNHALNLSIREENGNVLSFPDKMSVKKQNYAWENNSLGKEKIILPPFTPIALNDKNVSVIQREHIVNGSGLWDSLKSQGRELLAGPMRWELVVDGKPQKWNAAQPVLRKMDGGYAAEGNSVIKSDGGLALNSKIRFEYDGFFWSDTVLENAAGKTVDRLTLIVPLNDAEMPLFHVISNTIRSNPGGRIPAGAGEVWNGAELKRSGNSIHPQLVPHIWLGGVERGLTWFTDSSYGYRLRKDRGSLRLIRKNGILQMEIDIINRPVSLKNTHAFSFGMQATPVKPMEKIWNRQTYDTTGVGVEGMQNVQCLNDSILGFPLQWAKVPEGGDYSLLHAMAEASRSGKIIDAMAEQRRFRAKHDAVTLRKVEATPKISEWDGVKHFVSVRDNFVKICMENPKRTPSLPYKYSDPRLIFMQDEVPQYFKSEWWTANTNYFGGWRSYPVPSNLDYMIHSYYNEIKNGMHGVYLDDVFLMPNTNTDTVAKKDEEGELHSEIGILALRELVKRIAVIQHQFGRYPRVLQVHMTNAQLIPCFAFATSQLAWESMFGETPLPERYSLDNVLAEGIGHRLGLDSVALGGILRKTTGWKDWPAKRAQLSRSFLALSLPHGVKVWNRLSPDDIDWKTVCPVYQKMSEFGHWREDCEFLPYWKKDPAIQCGTEQVIVSAYRRPGKILLVTANLSGVQKKISLNLKLKALGVPEDAKAVNLETGTAEDPTALSIGAYDFKLIQIGKK